MRKFYTSERNIQIVIALMKANGIKRVVASPGATDISLNASLQHDPWFEMYSCIDERSAAYMACGIAAETGEPVAITCTGATSSRNYMPGLTEAYYRHLPILAITCCRSNMYVGHYVDQVTDRSNLPNDIAEVSVYAQSIVTSKDEWDVTMKVNKAILGLFRNGGGPCHINLETIYSTDYSIKEIQNVKQIKRFTLESASLPSIPQNKKIGIFVGAHEKWTEELTSLVDRFCEIYNAVVFCDHTSNYKGKYQILFPLISDQFENKLAKTDIDLLIHIGYISNVKYFSKEIWRVNPDGEIRNPFGTMTSVFQMSEISFFTRYTINISSKTTTDFPMLYKQYNKQYEELYQQIPNLPFSNMWVAKSLSKKLPKNSVLHLGIRNSIRSWSYFKIDSSILSYCNTGGFGIDGGISSLIGASLIHKDKLYYGVFGDLLFYYDMNSLGNRDLGNNVRIMVINNGLGQEFKNYNCNSACLGDETDDFIAAKGHFGGHPNCELIRNYALSLGFEYLRASNKEEFENVYKRFICPELTDKPMLFEVITDTKDESNAFELLTTITSKSKMAKKTKDVLSMEILSPIKEIAKSIINK